MGLEFVRFEVWLDREAKDRYIFLSREIRRLVNRINRLWLTFHTQAGNDVKVNRYVTGLREWQRKNSEKKGSGGNKPELKLDCMPEKLKQLINDDLVSSFPRLGRRTLDLAKQVALSNFFKKAAGSAFRSWIIALADEGRLPSSTKELQPIPFDSRSAKITPPVSDGEDFHVELRLESEPLRKGRQKRDSINDRLKMVTKRKGMGRQIDVLWKIIGEEYELKGSNIVYKESNRKWFVLIAYMAPETEKPKLDPDRIAVLSAADTRPWHLEIDSYQHWMGGRTGRHVTHVRRQLLTQRFGRQEAYRHAGSARKGHGRRRAMGAVDKLTQTWKNFVKTANERLAKDVVEKCLEKGCGTIVYQQPTDDFRSSRFLTTAGKLDDRHESSGWDWYQVGTILSRKAAQSGIKVIVENVEGVPKAA